MSDKETDPRGWYIAKNEVRSRDERSQAQLHRHTKAATALLHSLKEEFGHSKFSFEDILDSLGTYCGSGVQNFETTSRELRTSINNLLKRELVEIVEENEFEITLEGHMVVEDVPEGFDNFSDDE